MWVAHMVSSLQIRNCALVSSFLDFLYKSNSDRSSEVSINIWALLSNLSFAGFSFIRWKTNMLG